MLLRSTRAIMAAAAMLPLGTSVAQAATLSDLVAGGSLVEGDVIFDDFWFDDRFGDDATGSDPDRQDTPFAGDRSVDATEIEVTTSSTASAVSLIATINPAISIADGFSSSFDHIFDFFLDFSVSVDSRSSREITGVTLGDGDLFATGDGVSEILYDILGVGPGGNDLEIFEATGFLPASQTSDSVALTATRALALEGQVEGNTADGATAGLSTFALTFDLAGTLPPHVIPLPAGLPLLLTALTALGLVRRAQRG